MTDNYTRVKRTRPATVAVSDALFQQVYDSPAALPGKERWVTSDEDVREIERLLGMEPKTIHAPLWVSGDTRHCPNCERESSWLDIIASGLAKVHSTKMMVSVLLGERKYVNLEAPRAIADLVCFNCKNPIHDLRSFKCHNWAYARPAMLEVYEQVARHIGK